MSPPRQLDTLVLRADHTDKSPDVTPAISVSTIFKTPRDVNLDELDPLNPTHHIYSRYTQSVRTRLEQVLSAVCNGHAITYSSGLAASFAALIFLKPKRIAVTDGYHGFYETIKVYEKARGQKMTLIRIDDDFQEGDVCWVETPLNPKGISKDIKHYANKAHLAGAKIVVDSTFAPPPLQDPFKWGADVVMHSATKYLGGHSDVLCGVLVVKDEDCWKELWHDRTYSGNTLGSLETWLLLRSLRTLHLRVPRQSRTATALVQWLHRLTMIPDGDEWDGVKGGIIREVWHTSLQKKTVDFDPKAQMEGGYNATFGILLAKPEWAAALPFTLQCFTPSTSLGSIESVIEQRIRSDAGADPRIVRISVGGEHFEDLKTDLRRGLREITANGKL